MFAHFAEKSLFCYSHFTKLTKMNDFYKKICVYQKKAVPLQWIYKSNIITIKFYSQINN